MKRSPCRIGSASTQSARRASPSDAAGEAVQLTDYVLEQPPVYAGPPCPPDPSVQAGGSAGGQARASGGRGFPAQCQGAFRLRAGRAGERDRLTSAPMWRSRRRPASPTIRWCASTASSPAAPANTTCRRGSIFNKPGAQGDLDRARLQSASDRQHHKPARRQGRSVREDVAGARRAAFRRGEARSWSARSKC